VFRFSKARESRESTRMKMRLKFPVRAPGPSPSGCCLVTSWGTATVSITGTRSRRSVGREIVPVRSGRGVIEKNIEVQIARRFKPRSFRGSWTRPGAEHLLQLRWLQSDQPNWIHWWNKAA
jgi:hypothetical protein